MRDTVDIIIPLELTPSPKQKLNAGEFSRFDHFFPCRFVLVGGKTEEGDVFPFHFLFQFYQIGHFSFTGTAPGRPHVDIQIFPFEILQGVSFTVNVLGLEVRGKFAGNGNVPFVILCFIGSP